MKKEDELMLPKLIMHFEKWKYNKEYNIYVSNFGHFKNKKKKNLPMFVTNTGYCCVKTEYGLKSAHRLVMLTFKPIPNAESLTIDHLNHNKRDNTLSNLEWVTREENFARAKHDFIDDELCDSNDTSIIYTVDGASYTSIDDFIEQVYDGVDNKKKAKTLYDFRNRVISCTKKLKSNTFNFLGKNISIREYNSF